MLTAIAGVRWSAKSGDILDPDIGTAKKWIEAGYAVPIHEQKPETAKLAPVEKAVKRSKKRH